jgi:hypothetical protein
MKNRLTAKNIKIDIKAINALFVEIEALKDTRPEVYCSASERYEINPRIDLLYFRVDRTIKASATSYGLDCEDIVTMTNDGHALTFYTNQILERQEASNGQ